MQCLLVLLCIEVKTVITCSSDLCNDLALSVKNFDVKTLTEVFRSVKIVRKIKKYKTMVPTVTGKQGKLGKMVRHFPVREKSENFGKTGKVREFYSNYWKNQKKLCCKIEKKYWKS